MKTYNAQDGQSTYDVALNTYGTLDKLIPLLYANDVPGVRAKLPTGAKLTFDNTQIASQALRTTLLVGYGPISSLFNNGLGRLKNNKGGYLVNSKGAFCVKKNLSLSGVDVSAPSSAGFVAADFVLGPGEFL